MRYGRPIEIHQAVSDQYLNKIVSVEGFVSWNGISDGKHVYRLQDPSGTLNVTARDGASAPMVGERVWVLGPIGRTLSGMDKAMLEHARWVKQPQ